MHWHRKDRLEPPLQQVPLDFLLKYGNNSNNSQTTKAHGHDRAGEKRSAQSINFCFYPPSVKINLLRHAPYRMGVGVGVVGVVVVYACLFRN